MDNYDQRRVFRVKSLKNYKYSDWRFDLRYSKIMCRSAAFVVIYRDGQMVDTRTVRMNGRSFTEWAITYLVNIFSRGFNIDDITMYEDWIVY